MNTLRLAAEKYAARGWATTPLGLDGDGRPKKPLLNDWPHTTVDAVQYREFERAAGLGVVLGPGSQNLAVVDIDDVELAEAVRALFTKTTPYWVTTIRKRGHLYLIERVASDPQTFAVQWRGREIGIELKARGQQVAAPPTPGYEHSGSDQPMTVNTIREAWASIASKLGILAVVRQGYSATGFPSAWLVNVPEGERNKAVYVEAHRLREAGMPLDSAIDTMLARVQRAYENGVELSEREVRRTVLSAYGRIRHSGSWKAQYVGEVAV